MIFHSCSFTNKRESQEDRHIEILNTDGHIKDLSKVDMFAVFDGHGGNKISQFLYKNLYKFLLDTQVHYPISNTYINAAYDYIQELLKTKKESVEMGSTCIVAIIYDNIINVINVGDSRCIICSKESAISLSDDHKPNIDFERKRIEKLYGDIYYDGHDWRIKDLSLSRAFGDISATPYVTHKPDIIKHKITKDDNFLILASDGLFDVVSNQEVINFILTHLECKNIADELAQYAIKKGTKDNITIIIVFLQ